MIDLSLVADTTSSIGTGPIRLDNTPAAGFFALGAVTPPGSSGIRYRIDDPATSAFEEGVGTLVGPNAFQRLQVLVSSNSNHFVAFGAGVKRFSVKQLGSSPAVGPYRAKIELVTAFPYVVLLNDLGKVFGFNANAAVQVIFPQGLGVGFHFGWSQEGPGAITFAGDGDTTVNERQGHFTSAGFKAKGSVITMVADAFDLAGDLSA